MKQNSNDVIITKSNKLIEIFQKAFFESNP